MFFETIFVSLLLLLLGLALCCAGYLFFVALLPVLGFFSGFLVTAESIQELFGGGFLATVSSWVMGFVVGIVFAVAAYFFYYAAVAILAGMVGYELAVGVMAGLGVSSGVLLFLVGLGLAIVFVAAVIFLNVPKALIVVLTAGAGASMILTGVLLAFGRIPLAALDWGVVGAFVRASWLWFLIYVLLMGIGIVAQMLIPAQFALEPYGDEQMLSPAPSAQEPVSQMGIQQPAI